MKSDTLKLILIGVAGYLGYKKIIIPILEATNLKDTTDEINDQKSVNTYGGNTSTPNSKNPWSRQYVKDLIATKKSNQTVLLLTVNTMNNYAKRIYDGKGIFNDDEDQVFSVFRAISTKSQLSQFAGHFSDFYKKDLWNYLNSFLNTQELSIITNMVKGYKSGLIQNGKLI